MQALEIGLGDEVITTPLSFIASANPSSMPAPALSSSMSARARSTWIPRRSRRPSPRTRVVGVEAFGNPAHMDAYAQIAAKYEIHLIEDSCEALGTTHKGRPCGSFGRAGVFGFYPNKQITTGEGGMIVTDDSHGRHVQVPANQWTRCLPGQRQRRPEAGLVAPAPASGTTTGWTRCPPPRLADADSTR